MIGTAAFIALMGGVSHAVAAFSLAMQAPDAPLDIAENVDAQVIIDQGEEARAEASPEARAAEDGQNAPLERGADQPVAADLEGEFITEPVPLVFSNVDDAKIAQNVLGYLNDLTTATASFVQSSPSGAVQEGQFWLRRPRQLRMEYGSSNDPSLLIVATQGNVYVRDNALETTDFYPVKKTPLRFLLTKELDAETLDVVSVQRGTDSVAVTFADVSGDAEGDLTVVLDAPNLRLRQWVVRDPQNNVTFVTLEDLVEGGKVSNRLFRVPDAGGQFINN
ncbi:MAG: outer membrane lipoprotein carrier protein LolA [Parvularculaceae bacterium]|nr:MAG: outer membrane lipoprotein carrier protein LolA [Parvularculaceae bacterium]